MAGQHVQIVEAAASHSQSGDCSCGPRLDVIEEEDGQLAWAYIHNATPPQRYTFTASASNPVTTTITLKAGTLSSEAFRSVYGHDIKGLD